GPLIPSETTMIHPAAAIMTDAQTHRCAGCLGSGDARSITRRTTATTVTTSAVNTIGSSDQRIPTIGARIVAIATIPPDTAIAIPRRIGPRVRTANAVGNP